MDSVIALNYENHRRREARRRRILKVFIQSVGRIIAVGGIIVGIYGVYRAVRRIRGY
jgi:hypothetical protein